MPVSSFCGNRSAFLSFGKEMRRHIELIRVVEDRAIYLKCLASVLHFGPGNASLLKAFL
ncbi:uncharacterized protein MYCFIDRAFT_183225 [Pseudocercospora fijiensis CIRAD86]|uniref:Uncharacterized protein n=1 Tax=Pseudocercospora fijiensis (strain CIRAD86) TaxID=383855 RepID=M3AV71_PSEFD|nr:uncharacterized protein MYCFIDRAFT_183225 [Pseudocercospora fijiensis CIRAD86]EME81058.1 hypothetical protein MYCFIDRAFT_183225 [Pseudocercospora fijiensis CIRAD86]